MTASSMSGAVFITLSLCNEILMNLRNLVPRTEKAGDYPFDFRTWGQPFDILPEMKKLNRRKANMSVSRPNLLKTEGIKSSSVWLT